VRHELIGNGAVDDAVIESERQHPGMHRATTASPTTAGRFSIAPTPRIATCGWLMIGVAEQRAEISRIRHCKGPAGHLHRVSTASRARASRDRQSRRQSPHVQSVDVPDEPERSARPRAPRQRRR